MKRLPLMLLALAAVTLTPAAELAGVTLPDSMTVEGKTLVLNGLGLREASFLKVDVYVAGLYVESKSSNPDELIGTDGVSRIHMHFVYKKVAAKKMIAAWDEGFEKNASDQVAALRERIERLNGWMVDILKGDTMTFTRVPGTGVHVAINDEVKGTIEGDDFARALWSVWLGPEPPNAGLKEGMLGG